VLPHHPPRTRAERVRAALGACGTPVADLLEALDRERYAEGSVALRSWWRRFSAASRGAA
jgi:protein-glutamine gamma-glutamyltransferase